jgi:hypothetical protein
MKRVIWLVYLHIPFRLALSSFSINTYYLFNVIHIVQIGVLPIREAIRRADNTGLVLVFFYLSFYYNFLFSFCIQGTHK